MTPEQIAAAREWLLDCFPDQEDEILDATPQEITHNVSRHYDGGVAGFILSQ